jgi:hypothetical protein
LSSVSAATCGRTEVVGAAVLTLACFHFIVGNKDATHLSTSALILSTPALGEATIAMTFDMEAKVDAMVFGGALDLVMTSSPGADLDRMASDGPSRGCLPTGHIHAFY